MLAVSVASLAACTFPDHTFNDALFEAESAGGANAAAGSGGAAGSTSAQAGSAGDESGGLAGASAGGGDSSGHAGDGGGGASVGGASAGGEAGGGGAGAGGISNGGAAGENGGEAGAGRGGVGGESAGTSSAGVAGISGSAGAAGSPGGTAGIAGSTAEGGAGATAGNAGSTGNAGQSGSANGGGGAAGAIGGAGQAGVAGQAGAQSGGGNGGSAGSSGGGQAGTGGAPPVVPVVVSIDPTDGTSDVPPSSTITLTFNEPMEMASLAVTSTSGACTGAIQISCAGSAFTSCIGIASAVTSGATVIVTTTDPLPAGDFCQTRVTTAAESSAGKALASAYTSVGFTVAPTMPGACSMPDVVISQVFGGGGNSMALWKNDFIELFNRSDHAIPLDGYSVQYAASGGTAWTTTPLFGTIDAGHYFLVQEAIGMNMTAMALPSPDVAGTIPMGATSGKVALVSNVTTLAGACPTGGSTVDLVAYGTGSTCLSATPNLSASKSASRSGGGCTDTGMVAADFVTNAPAPHNSSTAASVCTACK